MPLPQSSVRQGANPGDLWPPKLRELGFINELISGLQFVCVPGSVGDGSPSRCCPTTCVTGCLLGSQRGGIVEAAWERERAMAHMDWGSVLAPSFPSQEALCQSFASFAM